MSPGLGAHAVGPEKMGQIFVETLALNPCGYRLRGRDD